MTQTHRFSFLRVPAAKLPITLVHQALKFSLLAVSVIQMVLFTAVVSASPASAQTVTYAGSGAVNFGSANVCPSGKTTPAPCSQTLTLTFNVTDSGTLGTPQALTTGAPDLDYKLASGTTCAGRIVKGSSCTVNATFAPIAAGQRKGAVEIVDTGGNVLASVYIYGAGTGPAVAFSPSALFQLHSFFDLQGIAVDASGNIFVASSNYSGIREILAASGYTTINTLGGGLNDPYGVAVDGAGNVFVTDDQYTAVKEILRAGGYTKVNILGDEFDEPAGLAVDGNGNVFVADLGNRAVKELLAAGGYATVKTVGSGFDGPSGVAVDGSGNVFVTDAYNAAVKEITASSGYSTVKSLGHGFAIPAALAVDASGNLYVADVGSNETDEILAAGDYTTVNTLDSSLPEPMAVAVDATGNVYIGSSPYNRTGPSIGTVTELSRSQPPSFAFGQANVGAKSSPQSALLQNIGNANLVGSLSVSPNWDQVAGSGTPADCTASFSLIPGGECNLSISFEPTEAGSLTGDASLTDNALNETEASQSIPLSGTGVETVPPKITSLNTTYAAPYSVVILYGTNFGATQGSSSVTFNGIATPHYHWAETEIYVTVPPNATTGNLAVTVAGVTSNPVAFTVVPQPTVTGILPTSGPVGTVVTISGTHLLDYENKGTVTFNGKSLSILSQSSTALKVAVPSGAVTGDFHVLVDDTGINTPSFTVTK